MMTKVLGLLSMLLVLTACTTHYLNARHPAQGQVEFDRDWYECQRENMRPVLAIGAWFGGATTGVHQEMAEACLAARGWRPR